jgi:hypothetical protein
VIGAIITFGGLLLPGMRDLERLAPTPVPEPAIDLAGAPASMTTAPFAEPLRAGLLVSGEDDGPPVDLVDRDARVSREERSVGREQQPLR